MTDASLDVVEASNGRVLGGGSIGDATVTVEAPIGAEIRDRDVGALLREIQAVGRARSELDADEVRRAVADGSGAAPFARIPLDTAEVLLAVVDQLVDDVADLLNDQEAVDEFGVARDELAAGIQEARPPVRADGAGAAYQELPRLEFASEHVAPILDFEKDATVRYGDDGADLEVGDEFSIVTDSGNVIANAEVRRTASLLAVEALEFLRMVGASYPADNADELMEGVNQHYDAGIQPSTTVNVITWEITRKLGGGRDA